ASGMREDVNVIGMPVTEICNASYEDPRQRTLFKNIMVLGALAGLMDLDPAVVELLLAAQYSGRGKERLLESNLRAFHSGCSFAREHLQPPSVPPMGLRVRRADAVGARVFVDGNNATALGCVYGGATVCAWYPITPSSSVAESFQTWCKHFRHDTADGCANYAIVQAEDEIASVGIITGAGWNGARAFTATSGPGISLMSEFIGLAYFAEIPIVIVDVQRGGPSTGMPTRTQQADLLACAHASHGDTQHVLLLPCDPHECFEFAADAFDLAERLQTPVFLMSDLDIGMNQWLAAPFAWDDTRRHDRGKVMSAAELDAGRDFGRYKDVDGDGIPWRTLPGTHPTRGAFFTRGTTRDAYARYSESGPDYVDNMRRLVRKFATAATLVPAPIERAAARATRLGVICFGSTSAAMDEALETLAGDGIHLDALRLRAYPLTPGVREFVAEHDRVFVVEQNRDAQMRMLLINDLDIDPAWLVPVLHYDGTPITARFIAEAITRQVHQFAVQPRRRKKREERMTTTRSQRRPGAPA
ncbi:MAG: 2-oxoacid:acceptor oxidoreductase family protein, partial [Rubrivivax sp.]